MVKHGNPYLPAADSGGGFFFMDTSTDAFDYHLPADCIAQEPMEPRDHSRLLALDRRSGAMTHRHFFEIGQELRVGDVLVMNDTKVFRARCFGTIRGKRIEVFLLRPNEGNWQALLKPGKMVRVGDVIDLGGVRAEVTAKEVGGVVKVIFSFLSFPRKRESMHGSPGLARVRPRMTTEEVIEFANARGEIPIPPYIKKVPANANQYQTVYARKVGSVAAPTAGFHFTEQLMGELRKQGIQFEFVTLHVGLGTFRPITAEILEEHTMHAEYAEIDPGTVARINQAKREGRRIIAVGTTTVRTLEGGAMSDAGFRGDINIFIKPCFEFKIIDGLITNFHLPRSSLLVLVSAFAGREKIFAAYQEAIREGYRFYSFGDAMFIR